MQLLALLVGGPVAMILTVLVGILVNIALVKSEILRFEERMVTRLARFEAELKATSARGEGGRVDALEDEMHLPLVKR